MTLVYHSEILGLTSLNRVLLSDVAWRRVTVVGVSYKLLAVTFEAWKYAGMPSLCSDSSENDVAGLHVDNDISENERL